jgi:hypothetical protein
MLADAEMRGSAVRSLKKLSAGSRPLPRSNPTPSPTTSHTERTQISSHFKQPFPQPAGFIVCKQLIRSAASWMI